MTNQRSANKAEPVAWRWRDNEDEPWQDDHAWWSASRIAGMRAKHRYVEPLFASPTGNSEHGGVSEEAVEAAARALCWETTCGIGWRSHSDSERTGYVERSWREYVNQARAALTAASVQQGKGDGR